MQRYLTAALAAALALLILSSVAAYDSSWTVQLRTTDPNAGLGYDQLAPSIARYGTGTVSKLEASQTVDPLHVELYCTDPDGSRHYYYDVRPTQLPSVTMVWNISVHAGSSYTAGWFRLTGWNPTGTAYDIGTDPGFRVRLYKGDSLEYEFGPAANGTSLAPQFNKLYQISAGETISDFRLVREIPEPAGLLALMIGFPGLILRRGK